MGSLTTRNSYGLKGYLGLSQVSGDEWGLEATASSLPACFIPSIKRGKGCVFHEDKLPSKTQRTCTEIEK